MEKKKLEAIRRHFKRVDPLIHEVMDGLDFRKWMKPRPKTQYFAALCREIITQQLSDKAAGTIIKRFQTLFSSRKITPLQVTAISEEKLRGSGMSWAKARYLKNIATAFLNKEIDPNQISELEDEAVINRLTTIKGIGRWTAEMFLIFTLGREDVFSHGDQGLHRALMKLYKLKNPSQERINRIVQPWSPYRSYGSIALWHSLE